MFLTDEMMDEIAQFNHDTMWETPEAIEPEVIREGDIFDCVHEHGEFVESGTQTVYGYLVGSVYECADCGEIVEVSNA